MVWEIFAVMYTDVNFRYINMIDSEIDTLVSEGGHGRSLTTT